MPAQGIEAANGALKGDAQRNAMAFCDPDAEVLACAKKMVEARVRDVVADAGE